jgi:hypothetical protein
MANRLMDCRVKPGNDKLGGISPKIPQLNGTLPT